MRVALVVAGLLLPTAPVHMVFWVTVSLFLPLVVFLIVGLWSPSAEMTAILRDIEPRSVGLHKFSLWKNYSTSPTSQSA